MLFGSNNFICKLQFGYVGQFDWTGVSISPSIVCYYCFYYFDSGSVSSAVNVSCAIKLESIFKAV